MFSYQNYLNRNSGQRPSLNDSFGGPPARVRQFPKDANLQYQLGSPGPATTVPKAGVPQGGNSFGGRGQMGFGGGQMGYGPADSGWQQPPVQPTTQPPQRPGYSPMPFLLSGNANDPQGMNQMMQMLWQQLLGGMGGFPHPQAGLPSEQGWDQRFRVGPAR